MEAREAFENLITDLGSLVKMWKERQQQMTAVSSFLIHGQYAAELEAVILKHRELNK